MPCQGEDLACARSFFFSSPLKILKGPSYLRITSFRKMWRRGGVRRSFAAVIYLSAGSPYVRITYLNSDRLSFESYYNITFISLIMSLHILLHLFFPIFQVFSISISQNFSFKFYLSEFPIIVIYWKSLKFYQINILAITFF